MKETSLFGLMHDHWPDVLVERIENSVSEGMPDTVCSVKGTNVVFWVEAKLMAGNSFNIRPRQVAWHVKRRIMNMPAYVLARSEDTIRLFRMNAALDWKELVRIGKPFSANMLHVYDHICRDMQYKTKDQDN